MAIHFRQHRDAFQAEVEIARQIYESLLEEERRPSLLALLTRTFQSTYSVFLARNRSTGSVRILASDALPPERQRAYETHYAQLSPPSFFHRADFAVGEVFTDGLYGDYDAYLRSEIHNDFFRPLQADHLMFLVLQRDRTEDKSLVIRRSRDVGFYGSDAVTRLKRIGRHLSTAEGLLTKMRQAGDRLTNSNAVLEALGVAVFVTDRVGRVRHMTAAAEQLLRDNRTFAAVGGRLAARQAEFDHSLRAAIRDCADSIDHPASRSWRMLRVSSPDGRPLSPTVFVSAMLWADAGGDRLPVSLIMINDPRDQRSDWAHALARLFTLTPAESGVAVALCDGRSLSAYAASASISVQTARTLLKRAQEKTQTHTQAELVSLMLRSGTVIGPKHLKR